MSTLQENLDAIKLDKDTNLKPENLKKDVTCLGVTGTYEGSGGGTVEGIKQFSTIEEMQADETAQEGDLAVVYRSEVQNATADSRFQVATFPDTVVLDSAITDYVDVRYRAVDSSVMFDCMGSLDSSMFRMDCYSDSGEVRIEYTSSDGITYTRTDTTGNPVDFGTEIYYERLEMWNDAIGKFIQIGGMYFDGLFEYSFYKDKTKIKLPLMSGLNIQYDSSSSTISSVTFNKEFSNEINFTKLVSVYNKFISDTSTPNNAYIYLDNNNNLKFVQNCNMLCYDKNVNFLGVSVTINTDTDTTAKIYTIDLENETYTLDTELEPSGYIYGNSNYNWNYYNLNNKTIPFNIVNSKPASFNHICIGDTTSSKASYTNYIEENDCYIDTSSYLIAPTQLTATSDYVYEKEFYGKNGAETGTLQNKENLTKNMVKHRVNIWSNYNSGIICPSDASYMLGGCKNLTTIPLLDTSSVTDMTGILNGCTSLTEIPLLDTSNVTKIDDMFNGCSELIKLPLLDFSKVESAVRAFMSCTSLTTVPLFNTEKLKDMSSMFAECTSLTTIPQLNTSSVTTMYNTFNNCTSLTTIPLLNTSSVTNMNGTFNNCTNLTTIPLLDTSNVTNMNSIFVNCTNLTTIPQLNTNNVTTMNAMFSGCTNLTTIPLLNTSNVTSMNSTFNNCTSLTTIPQLNTSSVTSMNAMFYGCTSLITTPELNTSNVTDMTSMFYGCTSLTTTPQLNTNNVTTMTSMFENCTNLTTILELNTSSVTYISSMFYGCTSLTEIPLLNTSSVTYMSNMFSRCASLTTVPILDTSNVISMSNTFSRCPSLSDESLNNILAMCKNATSYTSTKTLKYIGLTEEQATKCTTLSNYSAFTSAGWTTGY